MKRASKESLLRSIPKKYHDKIALDECWWDEDAVIIPTKDGWCYDNPEQHLESFYSRDGLRHMVIQECHCEDCVNAKARKR